MTRKIKSTRRLEYSEVEYVSDYDNGEKLDTKVAINGQHLCCIAGDTIDEFHGLLTQLINAYKI
jgi:hypothetical protein